jgi:hypothetical protein
MINGRDEGTSPAGKKLLVDRFEQALAELALTVRNAC